MDYGLLILKLMNPLGPIICFAVIMLAKGRFWAVPLAAIAATMIDVGVPDDGVSRTFWYCLLAYMIHSLVIYGIFLVKDKFFKK